MDEFDIGARGCEPMKKQREAAESWPLCLLKSRAGTAVEIKEIHQNRNIDGLFQSRDILSQDFRSGQSPREFREYSD
jgi:hypothetical protein